MFNGTLFQQSLQDLVKGIRAHRRDESAYVREKMAEIAKECRSKDVAVKTTAVLKLTHLQMMGCNMSFASFYIVEVMCSSDFATKRIGYLAAAQSFSPATDVLLLTTNQFKKDLTNGRMQDCSQALTCLSKLVTESLACDLQHDVSLLLSSPRPYIRKKTLLVLYRFIMVYPETLSMISDKFRMCLEDPDPSVVCAAVTVTCELARTSPRDFLGLAPALYALLTSSSNNWMLIKIVKLMGVLTPLEPRLGKKLVGPLTKLMRNTRAKSLLYECCCTVSLGLMDYPEAVKLCVDRLSEFMVDNDQNLKYLGLLSMRRVVKAHPAVAMQHRDLILDCLDDVDIGIRMRALELTAEFVNRRTMRDIARILLRKLRSANEASAVLQPATTLYDAPDTSSVYSGSETTADVEAPPQFAVDPETPYRDALAAQLLEPGKYVRGEGYPILSSGGDFAWYIATVLGGLARSPGLSRSVYETVASQLTELIARVEAVRPATLAVAGALLTSSGAAGKVSAASLEMGEPEAITDESLIGDTADEESVAEPVANGGEADVCPPSPSPTPSETSEAPAAPSLSPFVVTAAAWVLGEHADLLKDRNSIARALIAYPASELTSSAHVALLGACVKVYSACDADDAKSLYPVVVERLSASLGSDMAEVHERAYLFKRLVEDVGPDGYGQLASLFSGALPPADGRAVAGVDVPDGLDLDQPLLDTGGEDLFSFLTGEASYTDDVPGDDFGEEDDLFRQLESAGDLSFKGTHAKGKSKPMEASESPYYLGSEIPMASGARNGRASVGLGDSANGSDDLLGLGISPDVVVDSGRTPVSVLVDMDDTPAVVTTEVVSSRDGEAASNAYGSAFDGIFGIQSASGSKSKAGGEKGKRKKKKKKKKAEKGPVANGAPAAKASGPSDSLIDFDGIAGSPDQPAANKGSPVPAHLGQQNDLLL